MFEVKAETYLEIITNLETPGPFPCKERMHKYYKERLTARRIS